MLDPYAGFGRIREEAPVIQVAWDGQSAWIVTRHDEVSALLLDKRLATNTAAIPGCTNRHAEVLRAMGVDADLVPYLSGDLVRTTPQTHARLRKLVSRPFTARRAAELRPLMEAIAAELLDALPERGTDGIVDLIDHYAYPLPAIVICELLGIPEEDWPRWRGWSEDYNSMSPERLNTMLAEMSTSVRTLVERRRAEPADDLLTALTQIHDNGADRLSFTELIAMVLTLMIASQLPTPRLIANAVLALLAHPAQLALLRQDPRRWPAAVHELTRWDAPSVITMPRYATEDIEFAGVTIRQGERVQLVLGSANRDPRRFPDPDRLDITRPVGPGDSHLGYSRGEHYCLGARLANHEVEVGLSSLFGRYPDLALAIAPDDLEWKPVVLNRELIRLPIALGAPRGASPAAVTPLSTKNHQRRGVASCAHPLIRLVPCRACRSPAPVRWNRRRSWPGSGPRSRWRGYAQPPESRPGW
jgi:cytochrome P450